MYDPPVVVSGEFLGTLIPETSFWDSLGPSYDRRPLVKALRQQWKVLWLDPAVQLRAPGVLHLVQLRENTGALVAIARMAILRHQFDHGSGGRHHGLHALGRCDL